MDNDNLNNEEKKKVSWYLKPFWVWFLLLSFGPFALPVLFLSPKFSYKSKAIITTITVILTYYFISSINHAIQLINNPEELKNMLQNYLTSEQMEMVTLLLNMQ